MRVAVAALVVLLLALGLGSALSWVSVRESQGFGALTIGPWTAWPQAGSASADPYTNARVAADGEVPLGGAEGIVFTAKTDDLNEPLRADCSYVLSGRIPQARRWSIAPKTIDGVAMTDHLGAPILLSSGDVLWEVGDGLRVLLSETAMPGNWLALVGKDPFHLDLTLYDSVITSGSSVISPVLPSIVKRACSA